PRLEAGPEVAVVVDLPVEHHPDRAVLVGQRLVPARQIDDAEPAHSEPDRTVRVDALVVRTPVMDGLTHCANNSGVDRFAPVFMKLSGYAAHGRVIFFPRMRKRFPNFRSW